MSPIKSQRDQKVVSTALSESTEQSFKQAQQNNNDTINFDSVLRNIENTSIMSMPKDGVDSKANESSFFQANTNDSNENSKYDSLFSSSSSEEENELNKRRQAILPTQINAPAETEQEDDRSSFESCDDSSYSTTIENHASIYQSDAELESSYYQDELDMTEVKDPNESTFLEPYQSFLYEEKEPNHSFLNSTTSQKTSRSPSLNKSNANVSSVMDESTKEKPQNTSILSRIVDRTMSIFGFKNDTSSVKDSILQEEESMDSKNRMVGINPYSSIQFLLCLSTSEFEVYSSSSIALL